MTIGVTSLAEGTLPSKTASRTPSRKISLIILMLPGSHPSSAFQHPNLNWHRLDTVGIIPSVPGPLCPGSGFLINYQPPEGRPLSVSSSRASSANPCCPLCQHWGLSASVQLPHRSLTLATHQRHLGGLGNYYGLLPEALMRLGQDTTQTLAFLKCAAKAKDLCSRV